MAIRGLKGADDPLRTSGMLCSQIMHNNVSFSQIVYKSKFLDGSTKGKEITYFEVVNENGSFSIYRVSKRRLGKWWYLGVSRDEQQ